MTYRIGATVMRAHLISAISFSLVIGLGLLLVSLAGAPSGHAQMSISNDGVTFPDDSEQTSAVIVPMNCPHGDSIVWDSNAESWVCETDLSSLTGTPENPGDLAITEIMSNPSAVPDTEGEWFEIYNPTSTTFDLQGLVIQDDGADSFQITGPVIIPANSFIVLGINTDISTNGGAPVDFQYSNFNLGNSGDEIEILNGVVSIDKVAYPNSVPFSGSGVAAELSSNHFDATLNDDPSNWCQAITPYGDGDLGTPGAINDCGL